MEVQLSTDSILMTLWWSTLIISFGTYDDYNL